MSFHSSEYLAGSALPDALFSGTGMTGAAHAEKGRAFVLEWLQRRFAWGFSEWKSETYTQFDLQNCANLAAAAPDGDVATRAAMVLDLLLYDLAVNAQRGMLGTSKGRSYGEYKFQATSQSTTTTLWLLNGQGRMNVGDGPGIALALTHLSHAHGYSVPEVILAIANAAPEALVEAETIGISPFDVVHAAEAGVGFSSPNDGIVWCAARARARWPLLFSC
jgi:hypothetical protein